MNHDVQHIYSSKQQDSDIAKNKFVMVYNLMVNKRNLTLTDS